MSIFFILGAGASVDSGLKTYRGNFNADNNYKNIIEIINYEKWNLNKELIWEYYENFYEEIKTKKMGETYELIDKIHKKYPKSFVLTQNVDGFIKKINIPCVEIHGNLEKMKCIKCNKFYDINFENKYCECGEICKPNVILYNEDLDNKTIQNINTMIKKNCPQYLIVIGTTMEFSYIENFIKISKIPKKNRFHINPNIEYKYNKEENIIQSFSNEGLKILLEKI